MSETQRNFIQMMVGDVLTLPDENGVMTGYIIERIEGTAFESQVVLKNATGVPSPERIVFYRRED